MKLTHLFEASSSRDKAFRKEAENYFNEVIQFFKNNESHLHTAFQQGSNGALTILIGRWVNDSHLDMDHSRLGLIFFPKDKIRGGGFGFAKSIPVLVFYMLDEPYDTTDLVKKLKNKRDVFIHEFIHYLDWKRSQHRKEEASFEDDEKYFNSPGEFNAYYQEAISEFEVTLSGAEKQMLDKSLLKTKIVGLRYQDFEENVLAFFHPDFRKIVKGKYRQKLKKRLYDLWKYKYEKYGEEETK
jgi:hypothetical protein